ncbi:hypothetical protein [Peredibacter starrii]|uniref:Uncharacterized protein n=1 Tax=Peredibacter starrii TaxID=28202 RepID=A0AAX4HML0_9BACT|nr:hypothetical protein [Peredibacter starrii]WPU64510.1 hypothetical protein SOO65_17590 [Peredibacter starrii]
MYRSWKNLIIQNESELKDQARIKKLLSVGDWPAVLGFNLAGFVAVSTGLFMIGVAMEKEPGRMPLFAGAGAVLILGFLFFYFAQVLVKEVRLHPIRQYLKDPTGFEFIRGEIVACHYIPGGKGCVVAQIQGGKDLVGHEHFHPSIWTFASSETDTSRRPLPVPVYILHKKGLPGVMIGIEQNLVDSST